MWGDKQEYRWFMRGVCVLFSLVIAGTIFPIIEQIMTYFIVILIATGAITWIFGRIEEAREMHYIMHASPEELNKEPIPPSILKREYPLDDYSE